MRDGRGADPSGGDAGAGGGDHPRTNGTNGAKPPGMRTRPIPLDEHAELGEPIDLVAVQADDELISALSAGMSVSAAGHAGHGADDRVAAVLAAWKAEVDEKPIPELVDVDTAVATIAAARPPARHARRLAPVAAAAALIVLACGGVSVGSYSAEPDDALWGVSKVLFSERAESVEAAVRVEDHIAKAKQALRDGQPELASRELQQAQVDLAVVRPEQGRTELIEVQDFLAAKALETPPGARTDPGAPLVAQPTRPVPSGAATVDPPRPSSTTLVTPSGPPVSGSSEQSCLSPRPTGRSSRRRRPSSAGSETVVPSTTVPDTTDPRTGTGTAGPGTGTGTGTVDPTTGADPPVTPSGPQPGPALVDPGQTPTASGTTGAGPVSTGGTGSTSTGKTSTGSTTTSVTS